MALHGRIEIRGSATDIFCTAQSIRSRAGELLQTPCEKVTSSSRHRTRAHKTRLRPNRRDKHPWGADSLGSAQPNLEAWCPDNNAFVRYRQHADKRAPDTAHLLADTRESRRQMPPIEFGDLPFPTSVAPTSGGNRSNGGAVGGRHRLHEADCRFCERS
jgi:hypothetical protein